MTHLWRVGTKSHLVPLQCPLPFSVNTHITFGNVFFDTMQERYQVLPTPGCNQRTDINRWPTSRSDSKPVRRMSKKSNIRPTRERYVSTTVIDSHIDRDWQPQDNDQSDRTNYSDKQSTEETDKGQWQSDRQNLTAFLANLQWTKINMPNWATYKMVAWTLIQNAQLNDPSHLVKSLHTPGTVSQVLKKTLHTLLTFFFITCLHFFFLCKVHHKLVAMFARLIALWMLKHN